jgi:hypothetical protein
MKYKMILPVSEVPLNSIVTKITGEKQYRVRDEFKFWKGESRSSTNSEVSNEKDIQVVEAQKGARFLVPLDGGDISAVDSTYEILWRCDRNELIDYLDIR